MALIDLNDEEERLLERTLRRHRSPWRRAARKAWRVCDALLLCYALNATVQLYRAASSPEADLRFAALGTAYGIAMDLSEDKAFLGLNTAYVAGRRLIDADFDRRCAHLAHYVRRSKETEREFHQQLRRIYDPRALFRP